MARRLRQVLDLYVTGKVVALKDGTPIWVQVLNPFEQDTARSEAQVAKARLTMALKEFGGDETSKVRMYFLEDGHAEAVDKLVDAKMAAATPKFIEQIKNDPEWTERLDIIERGSHDTAKPLEAIEEQLLEKATADFTAELKDRLTKEREFLRMQFGSADEDTLWESYLDWYLERRSTELMFAEYRLHQVLFGARWCEGSRDEAGVWDHAECAGHIDRIFTDKEQVRSAPQELIGVVMDALDDLEMTVRDAKNSDRQGSSSGSSPLPSVEAASTASTPIETPVAPPGTSPSPSVTP